jgi:hypothetical protein
MGCASQADFAHEPSGSCEAAAFLLRCIIDSTRVEAAQKRTERRKTRH